MQRFLKICRHLFCCGVPMVIVTTMACQKQSSQLATFSVKPPENVKEPHEPLTEFHCLTEHDLMRIGRMPSDWYTIFQQCRNELDNKIGISFADLDETEQRAICCTIVAGRMVLYENCEVLQLHNLLNAAKLDIYFFDEIDNYVQARDGQHHQWPTPGAASFCAVTSSDTKGPR